MLIGLAILAGMTYTAGRGQRSVAATSWAFVTPEWAGPAEYGETITMRNGDDGKLLFKHSKHPEVFEFSLAESKFNKTSDDVWDRVTTPIADCDKQPPPPPQLLRRNEKTGKLMAGDRSIPINGAAVMSLAASPSGRWAAVLTISEDPHGGLIPFLGSGPIRGSYHHQIYSTAYAKPIGPSIKVISPKLKDGRVLSLRGCWSADEQYVVYFDSLFSSLFIIKTDVPTDHAKGAK